MKLAIITIISLCIPMYLLILGAQKGRDRSEDDAAQLEFLKNYKRRNKK